jgi:type I restriction enzyme S subunit
VEFEFPNKEGQSYKSSDGKMVSSELGAIPEGWGAGKIDEISTISTGKGLKRAEYIEKGSYPVYGANGAIGRTNSFLFDEKLIITGRVGTLGNIYIVNGKMWISDNVLILKPEEKYFYFTYFAMKRINFQSLNRGSTQPLITQTDLKNFETIIPEKQIVDQFDLFSLGLFSKIKNNMGQIDHLTKIRDTLLPKLMSGQIRVK